MKFLSSYYDILGTVLIIQFNIITCHIMLGFKNQCQLFYFGCHGNLSFECPLTNFLKKCRFWRLFSLKKLLKIGIVIDFSASCCSHHFESFDSTFDQLP